jgi:predicted NodU family carbamoyl transferase
LASDDVTSEMSEMTRDAIDALRDAMGAASPETRRRAAMDVLHLNGIGTGRGSRRIEVTEEQLDRIGRVLSEIEASRGRLEIGPRSLGDASHSSPD